MEPFPGGRSDYLRGKDLSLSAGDPRNLSKNEMSKTLPAELEVLGYLGGEESLLVYISRLMYIAFDIAQCLQARRKGTLVVLEGVLEVSLLPAHCSWRVL